MSLTSLNDIADPRARALVRDWFERFGGEFGGDPEASASARLALEAHLIEAINDEPGADLARVEAALARLGAPEILAKEWGGGAAGPQRTQSRPTLRVLAIIVSVAQALGVALGVICIVGAAVRLFDPEAVGLFQLADGSWLVGTPSGQPVAADALGLWTAPVFLLTGVAVLGLSLVGARAATRLLGGRHA